MSDLLFEYKVRAKHKLGWKEFSFYATTEIEEFLNRNNIEYVRNATDTVENRLFKENKRLNNIINKAKTYCEDVIIEHKNGEYDVDTASLAIKEHKGNIKSLLNILNGDLENYWGSDKE